MVPAAIRADGNHAAHRTLAGLFPSARLAAGDAGFAARVCAAVSRAEPPAPGRALLPADVLEICLHERVRQELSGAVPSG